MSSSSELEKVLELYSPLDGKIKSCKRCEISVKYLIKQPEGRFEASVGGTKNRAEPSSRPVSSRTYFR